MLVMLVWPAIIAGGMTVAGGVMRNRQERQAGGKNRRFQRKQSDRQMRFQERMRNTEWQAGIADMEAAGINPALAYSHGGASAPMGASGSGSKADIDDVVGSSVSSAMQAEQLDKQLKIMTAQEDNIYVDSAYKAMLKGAAEETKKNTKVQTEMLRAQLPGLQNIAKFETGTLGQSSALIRALVRAARGR